jgi:hypothetical protein
VGLEVAAAHLEAAMPCARKKQMHQAKDSDLPFEEKENTQICPL